MKKFILGLGAQRSGTTFLFNLLSQYHESITPFIKELHIWDALEIDLCKRWRIFNPEFLTFQNDKIVKKCVKNNQIDILNKIILVKGFRMELQNNPQKYFEYFDFLLKSKNKEISFDITPEYIGLKAETLKYIDDSFHQNDIDCKFIIILRDPIDRCWSALKSKFKKKGLTANDQIKYEEIIESVDYNLPVQEAMIKYVKSGDAAFRTNYKQIIEILRNNFDKNKYLILLYEDFKLNTIKTKLEDFLEIKLPNFVNEKINISSNETINKDLTKQIAPIFYETYKYCSLNLPETKAFWNGYNYLNL